MRSVAGVPRRLSWYLDPPMAAALVAGGALTLFVTVSPVVRFAYDNLSLHVALETGEGLIGGLLASMAVGRYRARHNRRDAVLAWTFTVLAATNLLLSAGPIVALGSRPEGAVTWAVAGARLIGTVGLCAAALLPAAINGRPVDVRRWLVVGSALVLGVVALASWAAGTWLADAIDPTLSPESSSRPRIVGHPAVLTIQVLAMALFTAAALGFARRARAAADELLRWLAAGCALAAFARLNYFLFPSLYSNWVYTGDVLRLGSYLFFLVGASRQIDAYRRDQTRLAVLEERRRMARDLHDGLIQELSFIRSQTAAWASGTQYPGMADHLARAADRALYESRRAVEALSGTGPVGLAEALREAAGEIAGRAGTTVSVHGDGVGDVPPDIRDALARVVREATSNAVRHGRAGAVTIRLRGDQGAVGVRYTDDGKGFDPAATKGGGFGLQTMRERVEALGGQFCVRSTPGRGTEIELTVPLSGRPA